VVGGEDDRPLFRDILTSAGENNLAEVETKGTVEVKLGNRVAEVVTI